MATAETKPSDLYLDATPSWRSVIGPDPNRPGLDRWRLIDESIPVWAIIQHVCAIGDLDDATDAPLDIIVETANDYRISEEAVRAALAHYADHRRWIDARMTINEAGVSPG